MLSKYKPLLFRSETLEFENILPQNPQEYDNLQPPKENGMLYNCEILSRTKVKSF